MCESTLRHIEDIIAKTHSGDKEQLEAIFSDARRLIVEAPAGYGKTKTMISKIAYILASGKLPNPKKILALTFSVNAAYKIKKDVAEQLPKLLKSGNFNPGRINEKVFISNYHGFCRHILKLYGYLIHENLRNVDTFRSIDDSDIETMTNLGVGLTYEDAQELSELSDAIKAVRGKYINENFKSYLEKVKAHLLPNNYITYNSIILFVLQLFIDYPELLRFYHQYFPIIIVDEFQDTNIINYALLRCLVSELTKVIFIGDPLQRIYGFIGAVPNLMDRAKENYGMKEIKLKKNYRFKDNPKMLLLDKNIRLNAENPTDPDISKYAPIDLKIFENQAKEAEWIREKIQDIIREDGSVKVAVLVRSRSRNVMEIINSLENGGVDYFYGLYSDEDEFYIKFHQDCMNIFANHIKGNSRITKLNLRRFYNKIKKAYVGQSSPGFQSLFDLLKIFLDRLMTEYYFLTNEERINFILDTLESRALKQQLEYVDKNVILSTIHGAKGLEWDYVIMPDMEQYGFPTYYSLCGTCGYKHNQIRDGFCQLVYDKKIERQFLEELSVFYVGVTRARKDIFFSSSRRRIHYSGEERETYVSCMLSLPGIKP
ncbi:UvrD-helicase domain-containing protein [Desulfofundulus thermocisternus]|uniref:UvrD-helicase domain-containing protein n=1 Tax=Desulfofundulus thermocisternus TaxID=42471 RepID=UPI00217D1846|nr:ATP-dependent helicase [Desulfofundulus thermocisternus]MCS5694995.1 ATP-dependent helicase [Desulfofundulus thermocisternus]